MSAPYPPFAVYLGLGSNMGHREANLRMRLDEYLPIGLDAGLIYVDYTRTSKE